MSLRLMTNEKLPTKSELIKSLDCLSPEQLTEIDDHLATVKWQPNEGPQTDAYNCNADELLYGGQAGGGKSDLILGLARNEHRNSIIFRRTYDRLEESLIPRSLEFYGEREQFNASKYFWLFRKQGKRIRFAHLERDDTIHKYKSAAFDLICFDELSEFTELQYRYLASRLRTIRKDQRCRIVSCTNPGDEGEEWIINVWSPWLDDKHPNPAKPGELRYFKRNDAGDEVETTKDDQDAISRTYIPASLKDNPYLGRDYEVRLNALPEPYRSQLAKGIWGITREDDRWQVIPTLWIRLAQGRWVARDAVGSFDSVGVDVAYGGQDKTVFCGRVGNWFSELEKHAGRKTPDGQTAAGLLSTFLKGEPTVVIDATGYGASCSDFAKEFCRVRPFIASAGSKKRDKSGKLGFVNKRAQVWWKFREALDPKSGEDIALPPDRELLADLSVPRWELRSNGIQIESKEKIIKRLKRSPDCGDALVLAHYGVGEQAVDFAIDLQNEVKSRLKVFG